MRRLALDRLARYLVPLYFSYGITFSAISAAWPGYRHLLGAEPGLLGILLLCYGVARAAASVAAARMSRTRPVGAWLFGVLQFVGGAALICGYLTTSWVLLLVALVCYGSAMGALDLAGSAAALRTDNRRLFLAMNAAFAAGTVLGPLLVSFTLSATSGWHAAQLVPYLLGGAMLLALLPMLPGPLGLPVSPDPGVDRRARGPWTYLMLIAVVAGSETAFGAWVPSFTAAAAHSAAAGAYTATAYWGGFAISRLAAVRVTRRGSDAILWFGAAALVVVSIGAVYLALLPASVAGFFLVGAAIGPAYPLLVADQASLGNPQVIARSVLISTAGSAVFPAAVGLAWNSDRRLALVLCGCAPLLVLIFSNMTRKAARGRGNG